MSIVKGALGNLKVSANLIPNWDYSIVLWYKTPSNGFNYALDFINDSTSPSRIYFRDVNTFIRNRLTLGTLNIAAVSSGAIPINTWVPIVMRSSSSDSMVKMDAIGESIVAGPLNDTWIPPNDPSLTLFEAAAGTEAVPDGAKLGVVAFYPYLNDTDTAHLIAGGNPSALPSATAPIEVWIDSQGVVSSGSNLTTWTGIVAGTVLTPSGAVTVDDADMAPVSTTAAIPSLRKGSQFTVETTLAGTVTSVTLNGAAITVDSHVGTTVTLTDSDGSITTSGEYSLVLTDNAAATETITVQVNVYGVAPSNNPLQKDGAAQASLTAVEVRISAGATLAGSQLFYSGTATTDVSGNLGNIDLSSTAAADADPVLLSIRTAAGDSIIASETVGII